MEAEGTKADEIALVLEDDIVSGRVEAGSVLRQEQLSDRFGVSRTPIREALRRLAAQGLVSFTPNRGVRVRTLSRDELREAFLVRAELEGLATELAVPRMTPERLADLDAAEQRFSELTLVLREKARTGVADNALAVEWMGANYGFHDVIYAVADSPYLERLAKSARGRSSARSPGWRGPSSTSSTHATTASTVRCERRSPPAARAARGRSRASTCSTRGSCWTRSSITFRAASPRSARPRLSTMALVSARGLAKSYGSVRALDGATFEIGEGVTGLLGSNGAGKTTSLKLFMGLIEADSGAVDVLGANPWASPEYRARIGYAPEHDCLPRDVSAAEFLGYLGEISGLPRTAARLRASDVLRHVGLFEERYRPIGTYSTGMKQKVKLAQALVHDPVIAFLDEPTAGLDPMGRRDMLELIRHVGREFGISIVISTHLMGDVERTCDAVVVLDAGRVLRTGAVSGLTEETEAVLVDVVDEPGRLAAALARRGLAVQATAIG